MAWTLDPVQLVPLAAVAAAYAVRARRLRVRGRPVARWRLAAFAAAVGVAVLALVSPLDELGEERLFSAHMAQHLLLGDVAPLLAVLGLSGPLLRPLLAPRALHPLRRLLHPAAAVPLWAASLWAWHVPWLFGAALAHAWVHALQHVSFALGGGLLWAALLGLLPAPRRVGPGARLAAVGAAWVAGGAPALALVWSGSAWYAAYRTAPRSWGLSPVADQRLGGGLMLLEMSLVLAGAALVLGVRWLSPGEGDSRALRPGTSGS